MLRAVGVHDRGGVVVHGGEPHGNRAGDAVVQSHGLEEALVRRAGDGQPGAGLADSGARKPVWFYFGPDTDEYARCPLPAEAYVANSATTSRPRSHPTSPPATMAQGIPRAPRPAARRPRPSPHPSPRAAPPRPGYPGRQVEHRDRGQVQRFAGSRLATSTPIRVFPDPSTATTGVRSPPEVHGARSRARHLAAAALPCAV